MEDPTERLIRRTLGRRPPPKPGPTLVDDVLRRVASSPPPSVSRSHPSARGWLTAAPWLVSSVASAVVLGNLEWSAGARAVAWGLALTLVPLAYSATLWPSRVLGLLALCGEAFFGVEGSEPVRGPGDRGRWSPRPPG